MRREGGRGGLASEMRQIQNRKMLPRAQLQRRETLRLCSTKGKSVYFTIQNSPCKPCCCSIIPPTQFSLIEYPNDYAHHDFAVRNAMENANPVSCNCSCSIIPPATVILFSNPKLSAYPYFACKTQLRMKM